MESTPFFLCLVLKCCNTVLGSLRDGCADNQLNFGQMIDEIRHSVDVLRTLPPEIQMKARLVYYEGIRNAFMATTGIATLGLLAAFVATPTQMRKTH
jgi:hypothetical protein